MKTPAALPIYLSTITLLSACGDNVTIHSQPTSPETVTIGDHETYTGNNNPVLLNERNAAFHARSLNGWDNLGYQLLTEMGSFSGLPAFKQNTTTSTPSILQLPTALKPLITKSRRTATDSLSEACPLQGHFETTRFSTSEERFIYNNCQLDQWYGVINGTVEIRRESGAEGEDITRFFLHNLSITHNNQTLFYFGRIDSSSFDDGKYTLQMNYSERNQQTGKINLVSNLQRTEYPDGELPDQIEGRVYQHEHGYIELEEHDDLSFAGGALNDFDEGGISIKGASHSQVTLKRLKGTSPALYALHLDHDGDGQIERVAVLNYQEFYEDVLPDFSDAIAPTAIIGEVYAGGSAGYERYLIHNTIPLYAGYSEDPDGEQSNLSYHWTLEEKPNGSQTTVPNDSTPYLSLTPDTFGYYKVSLKVTDADGLTDIAFRDYNIVD